MTWKLWLDDQLDDPNTPDRHTPKGPEWKGARGSFEATLLIEEFGPPSFMDLDFDLGEKGLMEGNDTAEIFLKWLYDRYGNWQPPEYAIHSKNVVGVPWIHSWMKGWKESLEK